MRGKNAKLISRCAAEFGARKKQLKQAWNRTPRPKRFEQCRLFKRHGYIFLPIQKGRFISSK